MFPAQAGVILIGAVSGRRKDDVPRTSGGDPFPKIYVSFSGGMFPAQAGVILFVSSFRKPAKDVPRTSGGDLIYPGRNVVK